jgi:hypothetical protein
MRKLAVGEKPVVERDPIDEVFRHLEIRGIGTNDMFLRRAFDA